jgi:hypothetical protein
VAAVAALERPFLIFTVAHGRLLQNGRIESAQAEERIKIMNESFGGIRDLLEPAGRIRRAVSPLCNALRTLLIRWPFQSPKYILSAGVATLVGIALATIAPRVPAWMAQRPRRLRRLRLLPAPENVSASVKITAKPCIAQHSRGTATPGSAGGRRHHFDRTWAARPQHEITLTSVCFRYALTSRTRPGCVLRIPARTTVGVVGTTVRQDDTARHHRGPADSETEVAVDGIVLGERNRG